MRDRIINRNVMKQIFTFVFLFCSPLFAGAQNSYFELADNGATLVSLTYDGRRQDAITIPATVSKVNSKAFEYALVRSLKIEGNPEFETSLYGASEFKLVSVDMGSNMTADNIKAMLISLGERGTLEEVVIGGFADPVMPDIHWTNSSLKQVLTNEVQVKLPPQLVTDEQEFGDAQVMGRFHLTSEIITFCGNASFLDEDDGSHWLFYIPTGKKVYEGEGDDNGTEMIYIQRVRVIPSGQGVLIHNILNTAQYADLKRAASLVPDIYKQNMLKGVLKDTPIKATDGDKTNLILYNGSFYPTSSGTFPAYKAYLQIPTESWNKAALARWTPRFDDETTAIDALQTDAAATSDDGPMYNMAGQRVANDYKGLIIQNGKKKIVK